ncbi:hypothetical protein AB0H76_04275 [Nocardia sp. NPDC050712]|uniref:hypothetical protein n=1 Tax=Nocardia sp. NPDC050712 TaxID=3155518 RepID=UPI0033C31BE7
MRKLSRRGRQTVLIVHLVAAGAWIGIDVIVAVLVMVGRFGSGLETRSLAYRALAAFVVWPMLISGLVCLATGVLLGLGTKWGLIRYWWVLVKLVLNVALCTVILAVLRPGMGAVGDYGRDLLTGTPDPVEVSQLFYPPAVSLTALTIATVLSVAKPWGRRGGTPARKPATERPALTRTANSA